MAGFGRFAGMAVAALALAGCTAAEKPQVNADGLTPKQAALLDKELGGKQAGAPVTCLPQSQRFDTVRVSDDVLLYRAGRNLVYRNNLRGSCPGLARDNDIIVTRQYGTGTCAGDIFHLVDRSSGIRGPSCAFGEFVPYRAERRDGR